MPCSSNCSSSSSLKFWSLSWKFLKLRKSIVNSVSRCLNFGFKTNLRILIKKSQCSSRITWESTYLLYTRWIRGEINANHNNNKIFRSFRILLRIKWKRDFWGYGRVREGLGVHMHPKSWHCQNWVDHPPTPGDIFKKTTNEPQCSLG